MPRGKLNERYVQVVTIKWMATRVRDRVDVQSVVAATETRISTDCVKGLGRADGLVAALRTDGRVHVVSMEAKSARTFDNINCYRDRLWFYHIMSAGLLGLLSSLLLGGYSSHWFFVWMLPIITFLVCAFVFGLLTREHARYHAVDVVHQVQRYPANEQWIVTSSDAFNLLTSDGQKILRATCKRKGIGLLRVSSGARVSVLEEAMQRPTPYGLADYLVCYARENSIRARLQQQTQRDEVIATNAYA